MKKILFLLILMLSFVSFSVDYNNLIRETLSQNDGYASLNGGVSGGANADSKNIYRVKTKKELLNALGSIGNNVEKIIVIENDIDFTIDSNGNKLDVSNYEVSGYNLKDYLKEYNPDSWGKNKISGNLEELRKKSSKNQEKDVVIDIPSNTTIVGLENVKLIGVNFRISTNNIIIRNIHFITPLDLFPQWDPFDDKTGNWNSQYDSITIKGGNNIWIDHCIFEDSKTEEIKYFGRKYEQHDGLVDITDGSDNITVSYNIFRNHNKTMLIGSSDNKKSDDGKLKVTLHHNYFYNIVQRGPRVRYGLIHIYNNYYKNDNRNPDYKYSLGVGYNSKIYAENNVVDLENKGYESFVKVFNGKYITLINNLVNGKIENVYKNYEILDIQAPSLYNKMDNVNNVKDNVLNNAGIFK